MLQIENTPFYVVKNENDYYITLGSHALLKCTSVEEAKQKVFNRDYELLFNFVYLIKNYEKKTYENPNEQESTKEN